MTRLYLQIAFMLISVVIGFVRWMTRSEPSVPNNGSLKLFDSSTDSPMILKVTNPNVTTSNVLHVDVSKLPKRDYYGFLPPESVKAAEERLGIRTEEDRRRFYGKE